MISFRTVRTPLRSMTPSHSLHQRRSAPTLAILATLAACWLALGVVGCERSDPLQEVRAMQAQGRFEESLEPLRAMLDERPDDPEVNYRYGVALNRTTSSPVAVWALRKAAEDADWMPAAEMELAAANVRNGSFAAAIESATAVLDSDPNNIAALSLRGMSYLSESKELNLALADFDAILELQPENTSAMTSRAATLLVLGRIEEAEQAIDEIDALAADVEAAEGTQAMFCATRAVLQSEKRAFDKAEELFEVCLEKYPRDGVVVEQAIAFFDGTGRPDRATEIVQNALSLVPDSPGYRNALSKRAVARGDEARAEEILKEGTELANPASRSAALVALSNFYILRNNLDGAIDAYKDAIEIAPTPSQLSLLSLADLLARAERHAEALEVSKRLERDAYRGLIEARVHLNELRPAEALARLEEVLPSWPNNPGARYYAGRAAEQLGDFGRAVEEYRQSIRSAPDQTDAGLRLAKIYLEAGSLQNAWNSAAQYFRANRNDPAGVRILLRTASVADAESVRTLFKRLQGSPMWPTALAIRAELLEDQQGVGPALQMLDEAESVDLTAPNSVELLRKKVGLQLAANRIDAARDAVAAALAANDQFGPFHEVQGLLLEKTGAPAAETLAAYRRAVELGPNYAVGLESLGRVEQAAGNTEAAVSLYRRAIAVDENRVMPGRRLAGALEAAGQAKEAEQAWESQLREHPWDTEAALTLARVRVASDRIDDRTLELAERAVMFQGGLEAQQTLIAVHKARGEDERAQALQEAIETKVPLAPTQITPIDGI